MPRAARPAHRHAAGSVARVRISRATREHPEVRLGAPFVFNKSNIDDFNF